MAQIRTTGIEAERSAGVPAVAVPPELVEKAERRRARERSATLDRARRAEREGREHAEGR